MLGGQRLRRPPIKKREGLNVEEDKYIEKEKYDEDGKGGEGRRPW